MDEILKDLVEGCKEEGMSVEEMKRFLPSAILAAAQRSPESGLMAEPMDALIEKAEQIYAALNA
jgi:hypothetical protein